MLPWLRRTETWSKDWGLSAFLAVLIVMVFLVGPLASVTGLGRVLVSIIFTFLLITGIAAIAEKRTLVLLITGSALVTLLLRWLTHLVPSREIETISAVSALVTLAMLAGVVSLQVFGKGPINWHRIQGAIAVYLLMGLIWAFAYDLILLQIPAAFQPAIVSGVQESELASLTYFSFVTLTTLGYGDITPVHTVARSLAVLEALVGQLYPAVLIGRLVAMELTGRQSNRHNP